MLYVTGIGEQKSLRLADGTRVLLNTGSSLTVSFTAAKRRLRLLAGEILVTTGTDPASRPFVVATDQGIMPVQWMYFLLGLADAWLFYGGNLLWLETRRRKTAAAGGQPPVQRRDVRLMAAATVGVCLGAICGISTTIVAGKWLHGHVADLTAWHRYVYYGVFFAAIAWAYHRGAARAAVHLLWLAAAATWAIPLTTLAGWLIPGLDLWAHGSAAALGVDATALAGGLGFAWLAVATARRLRHGPVDSVWSAAGSP